MRRIVHIITVALLLMLTACGGESDVRCSLNAAEHLMEQHPDSALAILSAITPEQAASSRANNALYALLLTQARYKNYIYETSDSLISIATDYYANHGDTYHKMLANLYMGIVQFTLERYAEAMYYALEAVKYGEIAEDNLYLARSYELMGDIDNKTGIIDEEVENFKKTLHYYRLANKVENIPWTQAILAMAQISNNEKEAGKLLLDSLVADTTLMKNNALKFTCYDYLNVYELYHGCNNDKLKENFENYLDAKKAIAKVNNDHGNLYELTIRLHLGEKIDTAYIDSVINHSNNNADVLEALNLKRKIAYSTGNYNEADALTDSVLRYQYHRLNEVINQSSVKAQRDYFDARNQEAVILNSRLKHNIILLIIVAILAIALIVLYYRYRISVKNLILEQKINAVIQLEYELKRLNENSVFSPYVSDLLTNQINAISLLTTKYYGGAEISDYIQDKIESELSKITSGDTITLLSKIVNDKEKGIFTQMRNDIPSISSTYVDIIALRRIGLSLNSICLLMHRDKKQVYNLWGRAKNRILNLPPELSQKYHYLIEDTIN